MDSVGGRRTVGKTAAIGASPSLAAAGIRLALAHQHDLDRDRHRRRSRDLALLEWQMRRTDGQDTVVRSVVSKNHRIVTWREP